MNKILIVLAIIAVTSFGIGYYMMQVPTVDADEIEAKVGEKAPDFELMDEMGKTHRLSDYLGKIVVMEWTNPQCPYIQRHYKENTMEKMAKKLDSQKAVFLAVNSSHYNTVDDTLEWKKSQKFDFATLQDSDGNVGKMYGAKTTPHMFVIDEKGILRYNGAIDDDPRGWSKEKTNYVDQVVAQLMAGKDLSVSKTKPYGCSVKYKKM